MEFYGWKKFQMPCDPAVLHSGGDLAYQNPLRNIFEAILAISTSLPALMLSILVLPTDNGLTSHFQGKREHGFPDRSRAFLSITAGWQQQDKGPNIQTDTGQAILDNRTLTHVLCNSQSRKSQATVIGPPARVMVQMVKTRSARASLSTACPDSQLNPTESNKSIFQNGQ